MAATVAPEWRSKASFTRRSYTLGRSQARQAPTFFPSSHKAPQGFFVLLNPSTLAEGERIFKALAENGVVQMPLQKTFWSPAFGVLVDRFGTPWEISCEAAG